jgi:hypothetical protein
MLYINTKDIRLLSGSLDLKNNAGKSLSNILGQLQSGSTVKGLVVGTTPKGDVIFHTAHGRFTAKNELNLVRGDTISLKLSLDNKEVSKTILTKLKPSNVNNTSSAVKVSNNSQVPKTIIGEISYLNLSKIAKNTSLFRVLNSISIPGNNKIPISLNVVSSKNISPSSYIISGEVGGNTKYGHQLIRTNFGIILSKDTSMLIGQKLNLEITSVNNQSLTHMINKGVGDFLFAANKNWDLLKRLTQNIQGHNNSQTQVKVTNTNSLIKNFGEREEIRKLSTELMNLKELIHPSIREDEYLEKWQVIILPFLASPYVENHSIKIDRTQTNFLKFIIDINLTENPMQMHGLIEFGDDNKTPRIFDLTIKSQKGLDHFLQSRITDIYQINQNISGIAGSLSIELQNT